MTTKIDTKNVHPGQHLVEYLVTDSVVYEIVKKTACTVTIRPCTRGEIVHRGEGPYPVVTYAAEPDPSGPTRVLRVRKDGTLRTYSGGHAMDLVDQGTFRTDYSW